MISDKSTTLGPEQGNDHPDEAILTQLILKELKSRFFIYFLEMNFTILRYKHYFCRVLQKRMLMAYIY
jgi:hypothetical protein